MKTNRKVDILIVDDERDLCFLLKSMLSKLISAKIDVCYSAKEAYALLKKKAYDIAYFDYQLTDGTGMEIVEFIQKETENPPFIVTMSANVSAKEIENWKAKGAKLFIPKPLSKEKINKSLELFLA
jgi:CheY-like chemotaxis protein